MKRSILSFLTLFPCLLLCLAALAPRSTSAQTPADDAGLIARLKAYRYGGDTSVLDALTREVAASRPTLAHRRQLAHDLAELLGSDASFEAKQFACRQLVNIGTEKEVPALAGLLSDDSLAHYALLALARIHGNVDEALIRALPRVHGRTEIEILDSLGDRDSRRAFPELSQRLHAADPAVLEAAVSALAKLSDPRAPEALQKSYTTASGASQLAIGQALLGCARRCQTRGARTTALQIYELLDRTPIDPALSAGVLRGRVILGGEPALPLLVRALGEDGTLRQSMAAGLAREIPGARLTRLLSDALPTLKPRGQVILLAALRDRGDPAAAPAVMALCRASDPAVRTGALQALGALGNAAAVPLLLNTAAEAGAPDRTAARDSLALLRGEAVDQALLGALDHASPPVQVEIIHSLGRRRTAAIVPRLLQEARRPQREVSAAALRELRDVGQPSDLPALVDLLLATAPDARDPAVDTVTEIARRGGEDSPGVRLLLERLAAAAKPADKVTLLTVLGQVGGARTLEALRASAADPDAEVRTTSLSLLAEWPTDAPMQDLLHIVRTEQDPKLRTIALRGYLRMIGANEQRAPDQALALFREAAALATRPEEKRLVLTGLARIPSLPALEYASGFLPQQDVHAEAELAVIEIGKGTLGAWREKTRAALEPIAHTSADEETRKRAQEVLARMDKFGDFVTAWEVSPAYRQEGVDYTRLFDLPFAPEEAGHEKEVGWRLMPAGTNPEQPWLLDLLALWGGEQRVAYLRTAVWSDTARDLVLELGSDDGVKVWWNGQVVLAHNTARAVAPAEEKVKLQAHPGWNPLLLKVTQNNQGWGACARFTNPDGSPAAGLRFTVPSGITAAP